jgi:hypothetical protein
MSSQSGGGTAVGGSNRSNRRNVRRGNTTYGVPSSHAHTPTSTGREPDMHGHLYDLCNDRNNDQYLTTTKELQLLVGRTMKRYTAELVQSITTLALVMPTQPADPPGGQSGRLRNLETGAD